MVCASIVKFADAKVCKVEDGEFSSLVGGNKERMFLSADTDGKGGHKSFWERLQSFGCEGRVETTDVSRHLHGKYRMHQLGAVYYRCIKKIMPNAHLR